MKNTDEWLHIENVRRGNLASYTFLVDKYKNMAYTIALKVVSNPQDAEDVAQESFVKAYLQIKNFEGKAKFSTWLYTIVYRTAVSRLQKNQIQFQAIDEDFSENYTYEHVSSPIDTLQITERDKFVKEAVQRLPKIESLIITLYYLNENSIEEIQEITGLTAANIKIKLFRARKVLGKELQFLL